MHAGSRHTRFSPTEGSGFESLATHWHPETDLAYVGKQVGFGFKEAPSEMLERARHHWM